MTASPGPTLTRQWLAFVASLPVTRRSRPTDVGTVLRPADVAVARALAELLPCDGRGSPGCGRLAEAAGLHVGTLGVVLGRLERHGLLARAHRYWRGLPEAFELTLPDAPSVCEGVTGVRLT